MITNLKITGIICARIAIVKALGMTDFNNRTSANCNQKAKKIAMHRTGIDVQLSIKRNNLIGEKDLFSIYGLIAAEVSSKIL